MHCVSSWLPSTSLHRHCVARFVRSPHCMFYCDNVIFVHYKNLWPQWTCVHSRRQLPITYTTHLTNVGSVLLSLLGKAKRVIFRWVINSVTCGTINCVSCGYATKFCTHDRLMRIY